MPEKETIAWPGKSDERELPGGDVYTAERAVWNRLMEEDW